MVRGLRLHNAVLPSRQLVDSGLAATAPLAFNLSSSGSGSSSSGLNASLVLDSCTVSTSCGNLAQFAAWLSEQQAQPSSVKASLVGGWVGVNALLWV